MTIRVSGALSPKQIFNRLALTGKPALSNTIEVPKGFLAVYVGEFQKKRYLIPVSFVNKPQFQQLLHLSEAEFGFRHPMGGLTIHCREDTFLNITSGLCR
ncbi:hypothetical protein ACH5RR_021982 [Cinchona calisaya]|uniref:Small auxin up regulated protein n=1 Tax=Cinchona calisaya TaxID=153742 RepID=A0ABD2Z9T5_9GENT